MWYFLYNVLLLLASPVILIVLLARKRCRRGLLQRLGASDPRWDRRSAGAEKVLWVHAVSLGEVVAIVTLVREFHARFPDWRIIVTTVTETGREAVEQRLARIAEHRYAPLDFPWSVSQAIRRIKPQGFLFVETELWPNLLRTLRRRGVKSVLVNGRISSRSFGRYALIKPFMRRVLDNVSLCQMQSDRDVQRILELGARPEQVVRTGNIKFDRPLPVESEMAISRQALGIVGREDIIVAGSTHPDEEEVLLDCYRRLLDEFPGLVLVLAPRHVERAAQVQTVVESRGFAALRRTALSSGGPDSTRQGGRVIILDTRGELAMLYGHACLAFVGGTLVPVGGHNLLEPAAWGKAVFFGPYTDHCAEVARLLLDAGGGISAPDGEALLREWSKYLRDRQALAGAGRMARLVVERNQGAVERALAHIVKLLDTVKPAMNDEG
jgi:3-deoxy-D-manno-octulosonic-acid transferase